MNAPTLTCLSALLRSAALVSATLATALLLGGCATEEDDFETVVEGDANLVTQESLELGAGLPEAEFDQGPLRADQQTVSLRAFDSPVKGQGSRGWCTAFATVAAIENLAKQKLNIPADLSEIDHYQSYRRYEMLTSVKTASKVAIAPETAWPYYGNPVANYTSQRLAKVVSYAAPETRDEVLGELAAGHPLVLGISTFNNFGAAADGRVPLPGGRRRGGHAVAVTGFVRDASYAGGGYLLFKNSWGESFGDRGYGKLPLDYCKASTCYFLAIRSISYQGVTTPDAGGPATPADPTPADPTPPDPTPASSAGPVNDTTVHAVAVHDPANAARFHLALDASPALLATIASVRYDVDASFGSGRYATSTDRSTAFKTRTVYKTYDRDWRTNGTEVTLVDGRKVTLAGAVIRW